MALEDRYGDLARSEAARARKLLDARLHRRPSMRDARWRAAMA